MIKVLLIYSLFLAAMLFVIFALYQGLRMLSYPKDRRYLHFRFIVALLLLEFVIFNYFVGAPVLDVLDRLIKHPVTTEILDKMLPHCSYELIYLLLTMFGLNLLLLVTAVVLFGIVRLIFGTRNDSFREKEYYCGFKKPFFLIHKLMRCFYDTENGPVLNARGHCMHKWAGGMRYLFVALGGLQFFTMAVFILWGTEDLKATVRDIIYGSYWLPMGGFLLTDQIRIFLDASPVFDADTPITEDRTADDGDLDQQEKGYRETFGNSGALLCCKELQEKDRSKGDIPDDPTDQQIADCRNGALLSVLCQRLKACGEENQSEHYQRALGALLDGKHINVCDQPEGEFFIYLTAYIDLVLSQGQTAVLLCKSSADALGLKKLCLEKLYRLNNISTVWSVCTASEANRGAPVNLLICSYDELLTQGLLGLRQEFSEDLKCIVIAHPEGLFAQDSVRVRQLFNELQTYSTKAQYVLLSETDNDNLRAAVENYMDGGELLPFNNGFCRTDTCMMVWKEESCHKLQSRMIPDCDLAPYLGTALPLALAAAKWEIPKTYLISGEGRPDETYWQCMSGNTMFADKFLSNPVDLYAAIRRERAEALEPRPLKQLICYDTRYHFLETAWSWTKYAGSNGTILHIVSPHYLLREYFADKFNTRSITLRDSAVEALIPYGCVLKKSNMAALLVDLHDRGMTEEELLQRSHQYGWDYKGAEAVLAACLTGVLPAGDCPNIFNHFAFQQRTRQCEQDGGLVTETFVKLVKPDAYDRVISMLQRAFVKPGSEDPVELPVLAGDITNYYLRGQQLVLNGVSYKVDAIRDGTVFATQYNDRFAYEYFPVSRFDFEGYQSIDNCVDNAFLNLNIATAKVSRKIYGYWKSNNGYRIGGDGSFTFEDTPDCSDGPKQVSILELNLPAKEMGDAPQKVTATLAFILNGLFKTLFPETHQNLFAVVPTDEPQGGPEQAVTQNPENARDAVIRSLIPFTCSTGNRKPDSQVIYIVEHSTLEYGMVRQLYNNCNRVLRIVQDYLSWYLNPKSKGTLTGSELHFGSKEIPGVFAPRDLLALLEKISGEGSRSADDVILSGGIEIDFSNTCAFCGKKAVIMHRLSDGRKMCNSCFNQQVTSREEIKAMLRQTKRFMEKEYGIRLQTDLTVMFKSAQELRYETDAGANERLLGFYRPGGNQLWLESSGPRTPMSSTLIHELTRCWQYDNLPLHRLKKAMPSKKRKQQMRQLLEGYAFFAEVQTLRLLHEKAYASYQEQLLMNRSDGCATAYRQLKDYFGEKKKEDDAINVFDAMKLLVNDLVEGREAVE